MTREEIEKCFDSWLEWISETIAADKDGNRDLAYQDMKGLKAAVMSRLVPFDFPCWIWVDDDNAYDRSISMCGHECGVDCQVHSNWRTCPYGALWGKEKS